MEAQSNRAKWKASALLLICVLAGFVLGVVSDHLFLLHQHRMLPRGGMHMISNRIIARLDRELDLTPAQEQQIQTILRAREQHIHAAWDAVRPRVREEMNRADAEIERVLTAEQRTKFRKLRDRWRKHTDRLLGRP